MKIFPFFTLIFILFTGCNTSISSTTTKTTEITSAETVSVKESSAYYDKNSEEHTIVTYNDGSAEYKLLNPYFGFNNFNFENCGQNHFSTYQTLDANEIGVVIYTNNANYPVNISISGDEDTSIDKLEKVEPHTTKTIIYDPDDNTSDNKFYSIVFHCAEENLNGLFSSGTGIKVN